MTFAPAPAPWKDVVERLADGFRPRPRPPLQLVVNRPCVTGSTGQCLVCDAAFGEPCRRQALAP